MQRTVVRILSIFFVVVFSASAMAADMFVYFGSHGAQPHNGFSLAHFDTDTGKLTTPVFLLEAVAPAISSSVLTVSVFTRATQIRAVR